MRANLSVFNLVIAGKDIPEQTDTTVPQWLGPKRASKILKLFSLSKKMLFADMMLKALK